MGRERFEGELGLSVKGGPGRERASLAGMRGLTALAELRARRLWPVEQLHESAVERRAGIALGEGDHAPLDLRRIAQRERRRDGGVVKQRLQSQEQVSAVHLGEGGGEVPGRRVRAAREVRKRDGERVERARTRQVLHRLFRSADGQQEDAARAGGPIHGPSLEVHAAQALEGLGGNQKAAALCLVDGRLQQHLRHLGGQCDRPLERQRPSALPLRRVARRQKRTVEADGPQQRPRQREPGIEGDGAFEMRDRAPRGIRSPLEVERERPEILVVRVQVARHSARSQLSHAERDLQRVGHGPRDLVLESEDVGERSLVRLRPKLDVASGVTEAGRDADAVSPLADAALEHVSHAERRDRLRARLLALQARGGREPHDLETAHATQRAQELGGEPVGEVDLIGVVAQALEGQHHDAARRRGPGDRGARLGIAHWNREPIAPLRNRLDVTTRRLRPVEGAPQLADREVDRALAHDDVLPDGRAQLVERHDLAGVTRRASPARPSREARA